MSRARLPRTDVLAALSIELRLAGYRWREQAGGKHGKMIVEVNGRTETVVVSGTPSDRRAMMNAVTWLRRRIREWKAEAVPSLATATAPAQFPTLEKETMLDSTIGSTTSNGADLVAVHVIRSEPRVLDADLGARLGYGRPERIRDLIRRHRAEFEAFGGLPQSAVNPGIAGGRPTKAYYLNEEQAILAAALSSTPQAAVVRSLLIKTFVAWRRGHANVPADWERALGIIKMLSHKVTETERSVDEILRFVTSPGGISLPTFNLAGTVTALMIIEMSGVPARERVRGTSVIVTRKMKDYCLKHSYGAFPTPTHIDPDGRWRFPREAATEWLVGESQGGEIIRSHVARQRSRLHKAGQMALQLVDGGRP